MMAGFLKPLVSMIVMLSLASCAFREDSEDLKKAKGWQEAEESFERNKGFAAGEIKHEFIPGANPNEYSVRLSWPTGRPLLVKVSRGQVAIASFDAMKEGSVVLNCIDGYLKASVTAVSSKYGQMSKEDLDVRCPFDYEVRVNQNLDDLQNLINGRLFLSNDVHVTVSRKDLSLDLIGIVVQGSAQIRTFDYERKRELWMSKSTPAPQINIKAKWATGHLRLQLNGVDGKGGDPGASAGIAAKGSPGVAGTTDVRPDMRRGDKVVCTAHPTNGGPGADGATPGSAGGIGGDAIGTSNVKLDIENSEAFAVEIDLNPGKGGPGGAGSPGQEGGPGGDPGDNQGGVCRAASAGAKGRKHPQDGAAGVAGSNGSCGTIQLSPSLIDRVKIRDTNFNCSKMPGLVQSIK